MSWARSRSRAARACSASWSRRARRLARGRVPVAEAGARVGEGLVELLLQAGVGEVDGAAVRGRGARQVLEHAPDLVVQPFLRRPAHGVARDRWGGLSVGGRGCRGRGRCGVPGSAGVGVVDRATRRYVRRCRGVVGVAARVVRAPRVVVVRGRGGGVRRPLYDGGERVGLGQALVGEEGGEAVGVALAHGADLPGTLSAVQLQGDHGRLGVQAGDGVAGDLGAVGAVHRGERGGDGAEPERARGPGGQGEEDADPVDGLGHGRQVHGQAVFGGGLPGDLGAGERGGAGVGDPLGAPLRAVLVGVHGPGQDRDRARYPDLQPDLGQRVVLSPHQFGRHPRRPRAVLS